MNNFSLIQNIADHLPSSIDTGALTDFFTIVNDIRIQKLLTSAYIQIKEKVKILKKAGVKSDVIQAMFIAASYLEHYDGSSDMFEAFLKASVAGKNGIQIIQIELAQPITSHMKEQVESMLQKKLFSQLKKCAFIYTYNEKLLGGMMIRYHDQVWDMSWAHHLASLRQAILAD